MSKARPFAVFDIDGTLIRWQLYHALADELAHRGIISPDDFQRVRQARLTWKKRTGENSFEEYESTLIELINETLPGIKVKDFEQACRAVLDEYQDQAYTYTRDLIEELRAKNYLLFAISASQDQIVSLVAKHYKFDDHGGSVYGVKNGRLTGLEHLLKRETKPVFLKELVKKHGASWRGSVAVGDSESDIPMLETVEQPIAFNPTKKLLRHARQAGWPVVIERKNMVYRLEPRNGSYQLTD